MIGRRVPGAGRRRALAGGVLTLGLLILLLVVAIERLRATGEMTSLVDVPLGSVQPVPTLTDAYVIVLENKAYDEVVGSADAQFMNELIARYGLSDAYQAIAHPSQPNYLALVSGSTQGVQDNEPHDLTAATVFDQLERVGRSWRVYAEDVPPNCFRGATAEGGRDGSGVYARKHEPAISFTGISGSPTRCANIQNLASFDPAAADLELIIPNLCHAAHDCPLAAGDGWLRSFVPRIIDSASFRAGGALFITFDEGSETAADGNHVATIVAGPAVTAGARSAVPHNHYSLLRTLEDAWGLDCLAESCSANTLGEFFH